MHAGAPKLEDDAPLEIIRAIAVTAIAEGLLWLPGLAAILAKQEWAELARRCRLTPETYGTDRLHAADPSASRHAWAVVSPNASGLSLPIIVEHPMSSEPYYRTLGLSFVDSAELSASSVETSLADSLRCFELVPDVAAAIAALVRVVHILKAPEPSYDVSHSDPEVPFSIFVSMPGEPRDIARFRLAESVLHEAMHLQLTLLETHLPIVARPEAKHYSPWKRAERPIQGVMHGLYVFAVIDAFLEKASEVSDAPTAFLSKRRAEIAQEVAEIRSAGVSEGLTEFGTRLISAIFARFT